jgi:type IX secretion system PorP/SprF family membrane protein
MKNKLFIWALSLLGTATAVAQDANFSQVNQLPQLINPANTGSFEGAWRVSGLFRNTSYAAAQTFSTGVFSVEKRVKSNGFIGEHDVLGVSIYGLSDQSNNGALRSSYMGFTTAFGKALNTQGTSRLAVGLQGVWVTRRLDVNKLSFEDQFGSGGFDNMRPSFDAYRGGSSSYLDLNAGLSYNLNKENSGLNLGAAIYHASKPKEQLWHEEYELPSRYTFNASGYFTTSDKDRIYLSALSNHQGKVNEYLVGGYFSKNLVMDANTLRLNIGSYYRVKSAVIPYLGVQLGKWTGGLSYDVASGDIRSANSNRKSLELSMTALF